MTTVARCKVCNSTTGEDEDLCCQCNILKEKQNEYYGIKLNEPIDLCILDGCADKATKTGLCFNHNRDLLPNREPRRARNQINYLTNGKLDTFIKHLSDTTNAVKDHTYRKALNAKKEKIGVGCEEKTGLPEYLASNPMFKKPKGGYCKSEYNCFKSIYKEGLCEFHYRMKHNIPETTTEETSISSLTGKHHAFKPKAPDTSLQRTKCATPGCTHQSYHTKYCPSCYQKRQKAKSEGNTN